MKKTIGGLVAGVSAIGVAMGMLGSASAAPVWETGRALGRIDNARGLNQAALRAKSETIAQGMVKAGKGELKAFRSDVDALGSTHVRMHQYHQGRRVYGADLVLHVRGNGDAYLLNGRYADAKRAPQGAALTAEAALANAAASLGVGAYTTVGAPELAYVVGDDGETVRLAWRVLIDYRAGDKAERDYLFADATTGDIAAVHPTVKYAKNWRSYDANRAAYTSSTLPGTLVCSNTQFCPLADAQDAHDGASLTYDYYFAKFGRRSLDNNDMALISSVNVCDVNNCSGWNNAAWIGTQMVYGDGDGVNFTPLSGDVDVIGHELTHGVTDFTSDLIYANASGALNEALSDIFGASVEAWSEGGINANTWKIGEDIYTPGVAGDALRYMNNPTQDGYSRDYFPERIPETSNPTSQNDRGGVHGNSGIFNLAYVLLVEGGTHPRAKTTTFVNGVGLTKAEQIMYRANTLYYTASTGYAEAAAGAAQAALDLYGAAERQAVIDAFCAVGVGSNCGATGGGDTTPPAITNVTSVRGSGGRFTIRWTTNEPATSVVRIPAFGFTNSDPALVTSHALTQTGTRRATYTYYVDSVDAAGNIATAGPFTHRN
ncbi:MAG: M4 family metallopeptidase [Parvularculaceae bacterium]